MLVDQAGDTVVTNDGATILRTMNVTHPTAKMIIEVARTQEELLRRNHFINHPHG